MSTETTNKKIKIDNGTTFGRTYTDKAVDELLKNVGGGGKLEGFSIDVSNTYNSETKEFSGTLTDEQWTKVQNEQIYWIEVVYINNQETGETASAILHYNSPFLGEAYTFGDDNGSAMFIHDKSVEGIIIKVILTVDTQNTPTSQLIPSITTSNEQQNLTIGNGLEIENGVLKTTGGGEGPLLDMFPYYHTDTQTISQESFDLLLQKIFSNEIVGISLGDAGACMLLNDIKGESISFIGPYQEGSGRFKATFNSDLSVKTEFVDKGGSSTNLTLPQTAPSSRVIPSITITNKQQNLTIGDGLVVDNGALKTIGTKYNEITITRNLFDYDGKTTDEKANYASYATDYTLKFIIDETNYNALLNGISTELGVTVDTAYLINNYNTLKQTPEYIRNFVGLLIVSVVGSLSSITNSTSLAYINNCCYIAIPRIEGKDSWFKCSSGFFGTLCAYDSDKKKMAKIGWDSVAENSTLTITTKYL